MTHKIIVHITLTQHTKLCMLFKTGLSLKIYNDSKIRRSLVLLHESRMVKLSIVMGVPHVWACSLILLWEGWAKILLVRKLRPECSATLEASKRVAEQIYSDEHCTQLYLYMRELRISFGSTSLCLKNEPILKGLTKIKWKEMSLKYFRNNTDNSVLVKQIILIWV